MKNNLIKFIKNLFKRDSKSKVLKKKLKQLNKMKSKDPFIYK
jgi:hypothetical protein